MSYVIKAVLSNAQHPEYGQVTVPFPVSDEEYDHTVEMLEPLGIGDALRQDCQVDELDSHYSVLKRLEGKSVNLESWTIWRNGWTASARARTLSSRQWPRSLI